MDKRKTKRGKRRLVQILSSVLVNSHLVGFIQGKIYTGKMKTVCVPGMNCYSCPGAAGACPIGAMQAVIGSRKYNFSFYVVGFICLMGVLFGRFICGWLCMFGLIQDLLYKIPVKKIKVNRKLDYWMRYLKYVVLVVLVFGMPLFLVDKYGISAPYFCKLLCPVGTLEGGIPLVLLNESLKDAVGFLFGWKLLILVVILIASIFLYRPFCKYLCPLGAFYALFNKVSMVQIHIDKDSCTNCGACKKKCRMGVDVCKEPGSKECIRCGDCVRACPRNALSLGIRDSKQKTEQKKGMDRLR